MHAYPIELRQRIVDAYDRGEGSVRELAERFAVEARTVQRYLTRRRQTGMLTPEPHGGGHPRALNAKDERALRALMREKCDRTDQDYAKRLSQKIGRPVTRQAVNRAWKRMGITRKKKDLHATERDEPRVVQKRDSYRRYIRQFPAWRRVYVDEFGAHLGMTRRYARAPRGKRARCAAPENTNPPITLVMGLRTRGVVAPFAFCGAMNGVVFNGYVQRCLVRSLRPGDVVIVDGLPAHRGIDARRAIERVGAHLRILPPYSPDLSPVEEAGAKVKGVLRAIEPRSRDAVYDSIGQGLHEITSADALGWFRHRAGIRTTPAPIEGRRQHNRATL
jgi:transposase